MTGITIRPATADDIPALLHHRDAMWRDLGRGDEAALAMMDKAAREYFSTTVADGSYRGFLAVTPEERVVGGGGIVISAWPGKFFQPKPYRAMILNMYVERDYRRRGIAYALMETMISWCRENDFVYVGLHASDEGKALYENLGFRPTNEMRLELR